MSESKQSEAFDEEIIVLTDADGVAHRVVPVLTAQGGDAYYFYFYEADDTSEEGPELGILKLRSAPDIGNEEYVPLSDDEWDEAVAIYDEVMSRPAD